jgi:hypothetical protein
VADDLRIADAVRSLADAQPLLHMWWESVASTGREELGRPGDNLYRLTFIAERPHKLLVEFDDQILVVLTEPQLVAQRDQEVLISFQQMTLDWQGYGDVTPHASTWTDGRFAVTIR